MKLAIATDAWVPQVNGVVRTLTETVNRLIARDVDVDVITPDQFVTIPCPGYNEIRLALAPRFGVRKSLRAIKPDVVHIATEGPIGWSTRKWCLANQVPFTTAFHTRFPDYASMRTGLSADHFWSIMRWFHAPSRAVLTATQGLRNELETRGIGNTVLWSRGIDHRLFSPDRAPHPALVDLPKPILLSVGRVAIEKNLEAFLEADVTGSKVIVGDGPALAELSAKFPNAHFMGALKGVELACAYATADVFVFPSKTDTFGLVMIEALASGVPVAAYPVSGPLDIVGVNGRGSNDLLAQPIGCLAEDIADAIAGALRSDRTDAAAYGRTYDWDICTDQFIGALRGVAGARRSPPAPANALAQRA